MVNKLYEKIKEYWNKIYYKFFSILYVIIGKFRYIEVKTAKLSNGICVKNEKKEQYIVSMASYKGRYSILPISLKSLLLQTVKPDKIIVWLDKENDNLPQNLVDLEKYGVEYKFVNDGLKAHKKYLYAMREYPNANIITVDDDLVYSKDLIKSLQNMHMKYPECVCARRVHKITFQENGQINKYVNWRYQYRGETKPSLFLCATGGGGTLYPSGILPEETFNIEKIKALSLEADDIWLKMMEMLSNIKVVWVKNNYVMPIEANNKYGIPLSLDNVLNGKNDIFLKNILDNYPEIRAKIDILGRE